VGSLDRALCSLAFGVNVPAASFGVSPHHHENRSNKGSLPFRAGESTHARYAGNGMNQAVA